MRALPRSIRYLLVGAWNTVFGYGAFVLFVALTRRLGISYLYAMVPAQILGILNAYVGHRYFTYGDGEGGVRAFLRFNTVYWVSFAANLALLALLVDGVGLMPELAQAGITVLIVVVNYFAHRRFSFRVNDAPTR